MIRFDIHTRASYIQPCLCPRCFHIFTPIPEDIISINLKSGDDMCDIETCCPICGLLINTTMGDFTISEDSKMTKVEQHRKLCEDLNATYEKKNHDYGDAFHKSYLEEGFAMARVRLTDKLERFKSLSRSGDAKVKDESIRDTLLDLANYAIMTVMEMDLEENKE